MTTPAQIALELQLATEQTLVTALSKGVIGFAERPLAARYSAIVRSGSRLDSEQVRQAWRILARDPGKLIAAGLELPGSKRQEDPVRPPQNYAVAGESIKLQIRQDGRIGVRGSPMELNESLKAGLHASWDPSERQWTVPASPACAAGLLGLLLDSDVRSSQRVRDLADQHAARIAAYSRLGPGNPLPRLDMAKFILTTHGAPWDHQLRGTDFVAAATASLLGFKMGGGKTATAIAAVNKMEAKRGIIMCPNKVRGVWPREVAKWTARSWHIVDGKRPPRRKGYRFQDLSIVDRVYETEQVLFDCQCGAEAHFAVWNYEMLAHHPADTWRPAMMLDVVIYDEIQRLKSPNGKVSLGAADWVNFTYSRIGLSGTPMPQYPWDIFGVYRALDPGIFGSLYPVFEGTYVQQAERKADGKKFPVSIKADKRDEFAEKVHSIMYRPKIDLKLPGRKHITRLIELEPDAYKEYVSLDKEMWANLERWAETGDDPDGSDTLTPKNVLSRMMRLAQFTGGTVPNDEGLKRRVSRAKEASLVEWSPRPKADGTYTITGGLLEEIGCIPGAPGGPEPVIVFCHFHPDLDVIASIARKAGLRYAEVSGRRSDGLTDASEMNPLTDIVGVQIQSGGTGVDLTRSRYGVWYSKGHSLGAYDQALARQDRPGQKRPVVYIHLTCPDTIDVDINESLVKRRSLIAVSSAKRGIDPSVFGVVDAVEPMSELPDASHRSGGEVVLPIDEYGHDGMAPRMAHRRKEIPPAVGPAILAQFKLEDF